MANRMFLAMTAAEFAAAGTLPEYIAWMACHFSPYGTGLTNLPGSLPPGSLLILNDRIPICGHDPERITGQLLKAAETIPYCGLLLDFQRSGVEESFRLAEHLVSSLPCPVAVSDNYATHLDCPVFLSPCPHHVPLSEHLTPWKGREIWLDLAINAEAIILTKNRTQIHWLPLGEIPVGGYADTLLNCHYSIDVGADSAEFTLWRTCEDMRTLIEEAVKLGISNTVSLFQEKRRQNAKTALE